MMHISEMFSARVPRYTSYPTAPHFHSGIDSASYHSWLATLEPTTALSLYVHIPFCDTLCWFCGCHTTVVNHYDPVKNYCGFLLKEIDLVAAALGTRHRVQHLHWGGGSPTMLKDEDVGNLNAALRDRFEIAADAEFAIEIDPRGFGSKNAKLFAQAGVTRASIGLQDCDPQVQRAINRIQTDEETSQAIAMLRAEGIRSINLDLVYGLPRQSLQSWEKTLAFALKLNPDRLAVFGYAHVPTFKKHQSLIPEALLPDIETRFRMAELARDTLCHHGFVAIGLDHFARPHDKLAQSARDGSLERNFQGYTTDGAPVLIGLGASAIGSLPQGYAQNVSDVPAYRKMLERDILPIKGGIRIDVEDRIRRQVIESLMCDLKADLDDVTARYGMTREMLSDSLTALSGYAADGVVSLDGGKITIAPEWRAATRLVCAAFDTYFAQGTVGHSVSV